MTTPIPVASALTYLGIAKEATLGTGVAPTTFIPVTSIQPQDKVNYVEDKGMRGSMVETYGVIAATTQSEFTYGGLFYPDSSPFALAGVLGDVATTGASAPYSTVMAVKNNGQPKTYTLTDFYAVTNSRQYSGQMFSEFGLKFMADGVLEYTAKSEGFASTSVAATASSWTAVTAPATWVGTATIAGSASALVESGEVSVKRKVEVIHTVTNTQAPTTVFGGIVSVEGKLVLIMPDDTEYTRYLTNSQPSLALDWSQGASAALTEVKCVMTKCAYKVAKITRGKEHVQVEVTFQGVANTTDVGASGGYSPCKWTIQNAMASATYV